MGLLKKVKKALKPVSKPIQKLVHPVIKPVRKVVAAQAGIVTAGLIKPKALNINNDSSQKLFRATGNVAKVAGAFAVGAAVASPAAAPIDQAVNGGDSVVAEGAVESSGGVIEEISRGEEVTPVSTGVGSGRFVDLLMRPGHNEPRPGGGYSGSGGGYSLGNKLGDVGTPFGLSPMTIGLSVLGVGLAIFILKRH